MSQPRNCEGSEGPDVKRSAAPYDPKAVRDAITSAGLLVGGAAAALLPRSADRLVVSASDVLRTAKSTDRLARRMADSLGSCEDFERLRIAARKLGAAQIEDFWGRARGQTRRGWRVDVRVEGLEKLRAAQEAGRGTILWRMSFSSSVVVKMALWGEGVRLVHLSQAEHGSHSNSWISRRVLTAQYRRSEAPYLQERVVVPWGGSPIAAVRRMVECLSEENATVSIVGDAGGRGPVLTPFLDAAARFPAGAPTIAFRSGAALLPTYAVREDVGRYRVVIEDPIAIDRAQDRQANVERAIGEYACRLSTAVRAYPESWKWWGMFWEGGSPYVR